MKLTKIQIKTLQFLELFNSKPVSIGRQMRFNWFTWPPLLVIALLGLAAFFTQSSECAGCLLIGLAAGAFLRDIGRFRVLVRIWPVYQEIINWQRVKELLEADEKPNRTTHG